MLRPSATFRAFALGGLFLASNCTAKHDPSAQPQASADRPVVPPHSSIDVLAREGLTIELELAALTVVDGVTLMTSEMRESVVSQAKVVQEQAVRAGRSIGAHILVLADRDMPSSALGDLLVVTTGVGVNDIALVVDNGHQRRSVPFNAPNTSIYGELPEVERARRLDIRFSVHRDGVEARVGHEGERRFPGPDLKAVAAFVAETKRAHPAEVVVTIHADADVTLQALVTVIDVVRGDGCELMGAFYGGPIPDACLFFVPILDIATQRDP